MKQTSQMLKNTAMKSKIDKSKLMKRAWEIYRREKNAPRFGWGFRETFEFRIALRMAWKEAKRRAAVQASTANTSERRETMVYNESFAAGLLKYYESGSNGRIYFGD